MPSRRESSKRAQRGRRRAARAGLRYVNAFDVGYSRRRCGKGFTYLSTRGKTLRSARTRKRIKALAIPPSWEDVWICPRGNGHVQATGRDESGRRQYIYHPDWRAVSAAHKFDRLALVATVLPRVRRRITRDLREKNLSKSRVVAAAVRLIDRAGLRVGSALYTERHGSHGVTTLHDEHVTVDGVQISLDYPGKSGRRRDIDLSDKRVAEVVDRCEDIGGQFLFCYRDESDRYAPIDSSDVNEYLHEAAKEPITAKDLRTWLGSVTALANLSEEALPKTTGARKKRIVRAVDVTASELGNTRSVARESYIHPALLAAAQSGELEQLLGASGAPTKRSNVRGLTLEESRLAALLPLL